VVVTSIVSHAGIDVGDCFVHMFDRLNAMSAFVAERRLKSRSGLLQISARGAHKRLIGECDCGESE
jgi:uncharacterized protein YwlG (UPF0340 family)